MIRKGMATKVSAMMTASGVNGIVSPNQESRYWPTNPTRLNASSRATPPTTGGSTSGSVTSARRSRCPGKVVRASTHASGTPMTREIPVVTVAVHRERMRAWVASVPLRTAARCLHGARTSRPARGSTRKATAISAGASKGAGTDRRAPLRAVRLARARAVRCDGAVRVTMAAPDVRSGLFEPRGGEHLLARGRQHVVDKGLGDGLVLAVADGSVRRERRCVVAVRDRHDGDSPPCHDHDDPGQRQRFDVVG